LSVLVVCPHDPPGKRKSPVLSGQEKNGAAAVQPITRITTPFSAPLTRHGGPRRVGAQIQFVASLPPPGDAELLGIIAL
jgi:hypothetical protein